ncbi:FixH family protein [Sabulicella glaciei]|uniref:FixH family protein n=1 Tax=Sabulicella glaciei TaxID=2984948 RepID=A0ABT3NWR4_9PROT|nr:FixH family protein [Roseococcus sp. MDT2-1-1]MCW8086578.1 FixH family protein [Roseococcus sp. MDT2-1-1]
MSGVSVNRRAAPRWIPLLALLPLLALMAADAVMAVLAARTDPGMVADAPRRLGMARLSPTAELRLDASVAQGRGDGYELVLRLRDATGAPVPASLVEARLERTTHAASDLPLQAVPRADGSWSAQVALPDAGNWQVTAVARDVEGRSALVVVRLAP